MSSTEPNKEDLAATWLGRLKNYRVVAGAILIATIVTATASFTDAITRIADLFRSDTQDWEVADKAFELAEGEYLRRRATLVSVLYDRKENCAATEMRCPPPASTCDANEKVCPRRASDRAAVEALKELVRLEREHYTRLDSRQESLMARNLCEGHPNEQPDGCGVPLNRQIDVRELDFESMDLDDLDLRDVRFQGSNLKETSFVLARLDGSNLASCNLSGANFRRATLRDANLASVNAPDANFEESDLEKAYIVDANFLNASLIGANAQAVNWQGTVCPGGRTATTNESCSD